MPTDPKYIDKRSLYTKLMEQAGRDYTARISLAEDVFFAGADTRVRRDQFDAATKKALVILQEEEAAIELQYGEAIPVELQKVILAKARGEMTAQQILQREG